MYYDSSQASTLKGVILILVGIGLALGLALIGSDLVNPIKSVAEYQQGQVERERIAQQNEIDLHQYEVLQEARTQAEVAKLQADIRHLQQAHEEELQQREAETQHLQQVHEEELRQREAETQHLQQLHEQELHHTRERAALELHLLRSAGHATIAVVAPSLLALSIALNVRIARRRHVPVEATADLWTSERKRRAIEAARWRERMEREQELREHELHGQETALPTGLSELFGMHVGPDRHNEPRC
jgi:hypothetical protein